MNSLQAACNQSSNRHPVTQLEEGTIEKALLGLREKGLVVKVHAAGSRSAKYKHILNQVLDLDSAQRAVLTVLLLRGVQTSGEIKQRCERMHEFTSLEDVEQSLEWFIEYPHGPLVMRHPAGQWSAGGNLLAFVVRHSVRGRARFARGRNRGAGVGGGTIRWRSRMEQKIQGLQGQVEELSAMVNHLRSELGA